MQVICAFCDLCVEGAGEAVQALAASAGFVEIPGSAGLRNLCGTCAKATRSAILSTPGALPATARARDVLLEVDPAFELDTEW